MAYKVLVVDDTMFMRKMAADCLKQYGYIFCGEATNGKEAVEKYVELQPDIVMMDLTMPEMNGIDAIKAILNINPDAVILVCSASNQQDMIFDALEAGAKGYLMKPFKPDHMNNIIEKYAVAHLLKQEEVDKQEEVIIVSTEVEIIDMDTDADTGTADADTDTDVDANTDTDADIHTDTEITLNLPESSIEEPKQKEEHEGIVIPLKRGNSNMRSFVSSLMCQWEEEINEGNMHFNVTCTESENKIKIETVNGNSHKQSIELTIDGFMQLSSWLQGHMRSKTS